MDNDIPQSLLKKPGHCPRSDGWISFPTQQNTRDFVEEAILDELRENTKLLDDLRNREGWRGTILSKKERCYVRWDERKSEGMLTLYEWIHILRMYRAVLDTTIEDATRTSPGIGQPFCGDKVHNRQQKKSESMIYEMYEMSDRW